MQAQQPTRAGRGGRVAVPPGQLDFCRRHGGRARAQPGVHELLARADRPRHCGRLCRALRRLCPRQCGLAEAARSAGDVRARRHRADRADHRGHDAADLCGGVRQPADAGCQPARHRPGARFRLGRLCALRRRSSGARGLAELRLHHDPLADFRHSGRAGGDAPLSSHRGIHLRLRPGLDRDHDHFRPGAGDRRVSTDRARSDQRQDTSICSPISTSCAICRRPATAPCAISICLGSAAS